LCENGGLRAAVIGFGDRIERNGKACRQAVVRIACAVFRKRRERHRAGHINWQAGLRAELEAVARRQKKPTMEAVRVEQVVVKDGEVVITGLPYKTGQVVEVIVLPQPQKTVRRSHLTVRQLRQSGLIGLWKDRADIEDSAAYARRLREQVQSEKVAACL